MKLGTSRSLLFGKTKAKELEGAGVAKSET